MGAGRRRELIDESGKESEKQGNKGRVDRLELPSLGGRSLSLASFTRVALPFPSPFSFHPSALAVIQNADLIRANLTPSSRSCFGELNPSRRCPPSFRLLSSCASPPENLPSRGENLKFKRKWPSRVVVLVVIVVVVVVVVVLLLRAIPLF